jgi:hypothetical protein
MSKALEIGPNGFRAAPVTDFQLFLTREKPAAPPTYRLTQLDHGWLASDARLPLTPVRDAGGRDLGLLIGLVYSDARGAFLPAEPLQLDFEVPDGETAERLLLPDLAGMFVFVSGGALPARLYMDHGGCLPIVYSPTDRRAASSPALLLDEHEYEARFWDELHAVMIRRERGGWISGTLTAHHGVYRVLPNHYLDLDSWTAHRFWPRAGEFDGWRDFDAGVEASARALNRYAEAATRAFDIGVTLTAGFDTRMLMAACRTSLDRCVFFTLASGSPIDVQISQALALRYGLEHRVLPPTTATPEEVAIWDRMVGDTVVEATRAQHTTLRQLTDRSAIFTGMYGEVGRCRLYRQDFSRINRDAVDARFVLDRLTIPAPAAQVANVAEWLEGLKGQPNSVILDLAFHELKFGNWAMGQRPISNSIKLNLLPMAQRPVLDAFIGVAPEEKTTEALFAAILRRLWPEALDAPINKYGDVRDQLDFLKKLGSPARLRRYLRDRLARTRSG